MATTTEHRIYLVEHRGMNLLNGYHDAQDLDQIADLELRDSDVFVIAYPKSGTIWMQQILVLLETKGEVPAPNPENVSTFTNHDLVPWLELTGSRRNFITAVDPREVITHLQYQFMPCGLSKKQGKVVYLARNPKDVLVSYFHFHKVANMMETPQDFDSFFEKFLRGEVFASRWFDHIKTWLSHKDEMNFLFITYEEMIQDLDAAVRKICKFLGKELTEEQRANVVKYSTFENMKKIPAASYDSVSDQLLNHSQGTFLRKGIVGDWKNHFSEEQNKRFDEIYKEEMKDFPIPFVWDSADFK